MNNQSSSFNNKENMLLKGKFNYLQQRSKSNYRIINNGLYNVEYVQKKLSKVQSYHLEYLTSQETLQRLSGKTIQERCVYFHRQFPEIKISPTTLTTIYKKNSIKKKRINIYKKFQGDQKISAISKKFNEMKQNLLDVVNQNYKIMYLDEVMFTYDTLYYREYSNKLTNIEINQFSLKGHTRAVIACISITNGLEYFEIFDKSIDIKKFSLFLNNLKDKEQQSKFALFLDNMRVHHGKLIKQQCLELDIPLIFNLPYSPQYNPIEQVFSIVKNDYKRMKLQSIEKTGTFNTDELIKQSFDKLSKENIQNICQSGYNKVINSSL